MPRVSIKRQIEELDNEILKCRAFGHSFEEVPEAMLSKPYHPHYTGDYIFERCIRCTTEKISSWAVNGALLMPSQYRYVKGYNVTGLQRGVGRAPFREEYLHRRANAKIRRSTRATKSRAHLRSVS
jgi:hypothetical protein